MDSSEGGVDGGHIARRTVAFFLLTSLVNVTCLILGGLALATGLLSGASAPTLGLVPALAGTLAIALALAARPLGGALAQGSRWSKLATASRALSDGVGEALTLLRTRQPQLAIGTAGYMLLDVAVLAPASPPSATSSRPSACCWWPTSSASSAASSPSPAASAEWMAG